MEKAFKMECLMLSDLIRSDIFTLYTALGSVIMHRDML